MFGKFASWLKSLGERRRLGRDIAPESFRELAKELTDLADVAEKLWPAKPKLQEKIGKIRSEMAQLDRLAAKPEFRKLSIERRTALRKSLMHSRDQLMETVQTAPSPTDRLQ